jgi:hypothetical protein
MLAACNETAKPVNQDANGKEGQNEQIQSENNSELTLEEVMDKSMKASEGLKSFAATMDMKQEMSSSSQTEVMNLNSSIDMKVISDPMALHQKMSIEMEGSNETYETESYFTADGMYIYDAAGETWMKFPQEMADQLMQISDQQTNPTEELKKMQQFMDDFSFEQDDKNFILKLNASGDKFNDFIQETLQQTLPPELAANGDLLSGMKINEVSYEFYIDKNTFYPTSINMFMNMDLTAEGESIQLKQSMNGKYRDYNQYDEITIPQEILDTAVEMEM